MQIFVGNSLLGFTLLAFLELTFVNGIGMIEHPAEPDDDSNAASLWRLPLVKVLLAMPQVEFFAVCTGSHGSWNSKTDPSFTFEPAELHP